MFSRYLSAPSSRVSSYLCFLLGGRNVKTETVFFLQHDTGPRTPAARTSSTPEPSSASLFMEDAAQLGEEEGLFVGGGTVLPQALQGLLSIVGGKRNLMRFSRRQ